MDSSEQTQAGPASTLFDYVETLAARSFEHTKDTREQLLRQQLSANRDLNNLQRIFDSLPWTQQIGELDRFQLQTLLESQDVNGDTVYRCRFEGCSYENGESTNAVEHLRGYHFGNRPHHCRTCDKSFTRKYDLQVHERTHKSERPYQCSQCSVSFTRPSNLYRHERASHPNNQTTNADEHEVRSSHERSPSE